MESITLPYPTVSAEWLKQHLNHGDLIIFDGSIPKPKTGRNSYHDFTNEHIPNAQFFDINDICDPDSELPHMMPTEALFKQKVQDLGVNKNSVIVVYDNIGIYSSARVWWMFKSMGHNNVAILDGGLPAWKESRFECSTGEATQKAKGNFEAKYNKDYFCDVTQVEVALFHAESEVLDARSPGRFFATEPEPRKGVRGGHMPHAHNLHYNELLENQKLKSKEELEKIYANKNTKDKKLVFSCGSGVTACILALGAELTGHQDIAVYDGSWSEWGTRHDLPVNAE